MIAPPEFILTLLTPFEKVFDPRTWRKARLLAAGAILAPGKRTVTGALTALGMSGDSDFSLYHHVLNRARWKPLRLSRVLLTLLVERFHDDCDPLVFAIDETLERRYGKRISALGYYRDATRSSRSRVAKTSGLRWASAALLSPISFAGRRWALPVLTAPAPSSAVRERNGERPKTLIDVARQMMACLSRWLPDRKLVVVADGAYAVKSLLKATQTMPNPITFVARLRMDASLHAPPPPRRPGQRGRPRVAGEKLPALAKTLEDPSAEWRAVEVGWRGASKTMEVASGVAVWYNRSVPNPSLLIRWVLTRDPSGELEPMALVCSDPDADPARIVEWFALRWQIEVTFQELRAHMGFETQRQWSDAAIARTAPALFGLFSAVALAADSLGVEPRRSAWYDKRAPTFADAIAATRRRLWADSMIYPSSPPELDMVEIPRDFYDRMLDSLCHAA